MPLSRLEALRQIVAESQAMKITMDIGGKQKKVYVDMLTARMLLTVYDALNEENKAKFIALPWPRMVSVGWKLCK